MTDLTTITTPFGLLDEATQKALKEHGGPYELFSSPGKWSVVEPCWFDGTTYRVRPETTRPLVVRDWSVLADWVRFVARDSDGGVWSYSKMPGQSCVEWTKNGCCNRLAALTPTIIDPGTCDWREAIAERPEFEPTFKTGVGVDHEPARLPKAIFVTSADEFSYEDLTAIAETVARELAERKQFGRLTNE